MIIADGPTPRSRVGIARVTLEPEEAHEILEAEYENTAGPASIVSPWVAGSAVQVTVEESMQDCVGDVEGLVVVLWVVLVLVEDAETIP